MKRIKSFCLASLSLTALPLAAQNETPASCPIRSLALFKNGLAVVSRQLEVDKPGSYLVDAPIRPVHGTFWTAPGLAISVSGETRKLEVTNSSPFADLQSSLLGRNVSLHVKSGDKECVVKGKVVEAVPQDAKRDWSRDYGNVNPWERHNMPPGPGAPSYIAVQTESGLVLVKPDSVSFVECAEGVNLKVKQERPVFIFNVKDKPKQPVFFSYLAKGVSWAPSYRMRLESDSEMSLALSATIKNELEDLKDVEVGAISGYPNIAAANITSLLCADTTWAKFFQESAQRGNAGMAQAQIASNYMMAKQAVGAADVSGGQDMQNTQGESSDIVLTPLGKLTLKEGGATWMEVANAKASYERIVECVMEDRRDPFGGRLGRRGDRNDEASNVALWDAIRFKNPFKSPITTAPVEISDASSFLGQCVSSWSNPGATTVFRVTKALSVTAKNVEQELPGQRDSISLGGYSYQKTAVQGVFTAKSYRQKPAKVLAKLQFSGELASAEGEPKCELREDGVYSVNRRNELSWEFELAPGEEKSFKYNYSVLVRY